MSTPPVSDELVSGAVRHVSDAILEGMDISVREQMTMHDIETLRSHITPVVIATLRYASRAMRDDLIFEVVAQHPDLGPVLADYLTVSE